MICTALSLVRDQRPEPKQDHGERGAHLKDVPDPTAPGFGAGHHRQKPSSDQPGEWREKWACSRIMSSLISMSAGTCRLGKSRISQAA